MKSNLDKKLIGSLSLADVIHFAIAVLVFAAISWIYFYPNDVNGDALQQHDVMQGLANSQEVNAFEEQTGEKVKTYSDPTAYRINVSAARGTADARLVVQRQRDRRFRQSQPGCQFLCCDRHGFHLNSIVCGLVNLVNII